MLLNLSIKNFAIVRQLDIDWQNGMTSITGETGAGKSIAIDALGLCLGERALTNVVRPSCKKAELAATFEIAKNTKVIAWLKQHDLLQVEDEQQLECILRRVISSEGRSKAYINGSQVPLSQLRQLAAMLINIHGQHDHQLIVKAQQQRRMLDDYGHHHELLNEVKYYFDHWRKLSAELTQLQAQQIQREAKQQLLQYQIQELDEFNLQVNEFESIETDYKRHSHAQDLLNDSLQAIYQLSANEQFNIVDNLRQVSESLAQLAQVDSQLSNIAALLNDALIPIEEANADLKHYHQQLELDPEAFLALEQRYSLAVQLAKKHQVQPEKLAAFHAKLSQELALISSDESRLIAIMDDIEHCKQSYLTVAQQLSQARQQSAMTLSQLITTSMQELNMPDSQFCIQLSQVAPLPQNKNNALASQQKDDLQLTKHGLDEVNFAVSINRGQPLNDMHKVASGGELSRIGLAIQVILAEKIITPTLIFDEVDVGISGPTAAMVGKKLQQLGKNTQVICVTHLPQVASKGHQQLFVSKLSDGEHTETKMTELNQQGRVREIARLLAGDSITDSSLANAQELLAG
jgi:DNA repair protein RecN (Recombination protein N)